MPASLLLLSLLGSVPAHAQSAAEPWLTLETEHYRLHTPVAAEAWAQFVAERLEEIRARVSAEVGPAPQTRIDIVLMDPARSPNGFALPLSHHPRMGIFPTAPTATGGLAWYRSWPEDLVTHEDTHLVHLMRPSRSPVWRSTLSFLGIEPMLGVPAWVIEGYATLVEGRLTGRGRPHSNQRAAWLRVLAQDGRLPDYDAMSGSDEWMGGSHRYLVGSAFLEWLERQRCAPETDVPAPGACNALPDLWARLTARKLRGFDAAFRGVFGDSPRKLYDRFRAEVGHDAVEQAAARSVDDSVWLDLHWTTAAPTLSDDGQRLAAVRVIDGRSSVVVWDTADDPDAARDWLKPALKAKQKDPEDVLPVPPAVYPRDPVATREDPFRPARYPRFLPDGRVLMSVWERDALGQLRPDLFAWDPDTGHETRITKGAELTQADPGPDGTWAVALRRRWGQDELVRVDLATGALTVLQAPPVPVVLDHPRVDPTGQRVTYLRHDGQWRLVVADLSTGATTLLPVPEGASIADPSWTADGRMILLALGQQGFIEIAALPLDGGPPHPLTVSRGAASAPEPTPDGTAIFHLGLDSDGIDLHRIAIDLDARPAPIALEPPPVRPPVNPDPPPPLQADPASVSTRPYGTGQTEWMPLAGGASGPNSDSAEFGVRLGDVIGRHEALLLGAWGRDDGFAGAALRLAWRGPPAGVGGFAHLDGFWLTDGPLGAIGGTNLAIGSTRTGPRSAWGWQGGTYLNTALLPGNSTPPMLAGYLDAHASQRFGRAFWIEPGGALTGQIGTADYRLVQASADLSAGYRAAQISVDFRRAASTSPFRLGGLQSSLLPSPVAGAWTPVPWLALDSLSGTRRDTLDIRLGTYGLGLFATGHRLGDRANLYQSYGAMGILTDISSPAVPLVRLPSLRWRAGLACVPQTPAGLDFSRCKTISGYAAWVRLGFET